MFKKKVKRYLGGSKKIAIGINKVFFSLSF